MAFPLMGKKGLKEKTHWGNMTFWRPLQKVSYPSPITRGSTAEPPPIHWGWHPLLPICLHPNGVRALSLKPPCDHPWLVISIMAEDFYPLFAHIQYRKQWNLGNHSYVNTRILLVLRNEEEATKSLTTNIYWGYFQSFFWNNLYTFGIPL